MVKRILVVLGTRPEVIKLVSFIKELEKEEQVETIICNTSQHLDMTKTMLDLFRIKSDYDLKIMKSGQSLSKILKNVMVKLDRVVKKEKPDVIVVLGDTHSSFGAALVSYYNQIPIFHIEGGIRSYNKYDCFPEEGNRKMIDHISDWNTCQTELDVHRLEKEGITNGLFCGNNSLDVIKNFVNEVTIDKQVLITMHRREGWGEPMKEACLAIKTLAINFPDHKFVVARHPNPVVYNMFTEMLEELENVKLLDNLPFDQFIRIMAKSKLILTDSGGVVQEAIMLRKPIVYLREHNEYEKYFDGFFLTCTGKNKSEIVDKSSQISVKQKEIVNGILESGRLTEGKYVQKVERFMEVYLGIRNAIAVTNGTVALQLISQYLGKKDVLVPALTFPATLNAFRITGNYTHLCDVGDDMLINLNTLSKADEVMTQIVVPVHLMGYPCDMDKIMEKAKENNWIVIEDAAEAFGAEYKGKKVGTLGDFGIYSFFVSHNVSGGEFGLIVTNDDEAAKVLRSMKNHGRVGSNLQFNHAYVGSNYKTNELCAGILYGELLELNKKLETRLNNAKYFHDNIKNSNLECMPITKGFSPLGYPIKAKDEKYRNYICQKLNDGGVETRNMFPCLANQKAYNNSFYSEFYPKANHLEKTMFYIGVHTLLSDEDKKKMVDIINNG